MTVQKKSKNHQVVRRCRRCGNCWRRGRRGRRGRRSWCRRHMALSGGNYNNLAMGNLSAKLCIYVCMYVYICRSIYLYIYVCVSVCICAYIGEGGEKKTSHPGKKHTFCMTPNMRNALPISTIIQLKALSGSDKNALVWRSFRVLAGPSYIQ